MIMVNVHLLLYAFEVSKSVVSVELVQQFRNPREIFVDA